MKLSDDAQAAYEDACYKGDKYDGDSHPQFRTDSPPNLLLIAILAEISELRTDLREAIQKHPE